MGWVLGLSSLRSDYLPLSELAWIAATLLFASYFRSLRTVFLSCLAGLIWGGMALLMDAGTVAVDPSWLDEKIMITADIVEVETQPNRVRLTLDDVQRQDGATLAGRVFLYGYGNRNRVSQWATLKAGDRIESNASLHLPENSANPGSFDYQAYCFDHHIALIGSVSGNIRVIYSSQSWLDSLRQQTRKIIAPLDRNQAGILLALLLADRSLIPNHIQEAFSASGAAHILAISGLHIGMVAMWSFVLCWWLLTRREVWIIRLPVRKCCLAIGLLLACGYALLAGWPLPTQRAVFLLGGTALAWWLRTRTEPVNTLLAALMLILFLDPQAVISTSLWLSFTASFALLVWAGNLPKNKTFHLGKWMLGLVSVSCIASLATLPIIVSQFEIIPVYSLLANALMVPLYTLAILPLALLAEISMVFGLDAVAVGLFHAAGFCISLGNDFLLMLHRWPAGKLWIPSPPWWSALIYAAGMLAVCILLFRGRKRMAFAGSLLVLVIYLMTVLPEHMPNTTTLVVWDAGQGASSNFIFPNGKVMVIDSPGRPSARYNAGTKVARGLRQFGQSHIDVLILSHAQQDHIGGAHRLLDQVRFVREVWLADVPDNHRHAGMQRLVQRLKQGGTRVLWLRQGDRISRKGYRIQVLWPPQGYDPANNNNGSMVFSLRLDGNSSVLFPGDIEKEAEKDIIANGLGRHDLLLIPHHGSNTSSSADWVASLKPVHAIAQTGRHNRYHFPKSEVVARYRQHGSKIWNTADGAIIAKWLGGEQSGWEVYSWKRPQSRNRQNALKWWTLHL